MLSLSHTGKKEISGSEDIDTMRTGYRVYLEDGKEGFKVETFPIPLRGLCSLRLRIAWKR